MGVDYRVWIIPQQRSFRPNAAQVAGLANALRDNGWVPRAEASGQHSEIVELLPGERISGRQSSWTHQFDAQPVTAGWVEFHSHNGLVLHWWINDAQIAGVQFPFTFDPYPESGPPYFGASVVLGQDYFNWSGENVMAFDEALTACSCGNQLAYRAGYVAGAASERIQLKCPRCNREFDPSGIACDLLDGCTGERSRLVGGLAHRFGLIVDCHKYWPRDLEDCRRFKLRPEFLDLWQTYIGVPFELVVTFN